MIPVGAAMRATLVMQEQGREALTQISLEAVNIDTIFSAWGDDEIRISGRPAGENFLLDELRPKVKTVADLTLRHVGITRVRITTKEGVHEGYLDGIEVESVELYHSLQRRRVDRGLSARLCVGGADFIASDTDLAEVIEEEKE